MSFTFDDTIPAANNNPSDDQPVMLQNNVSEAAIWEVDHVGFNAANGGTHKQVAFYSQNVPGAPAGANDSVLYTNTGTQSALSDLKFVNQTNSNNVVYNINPIKAYGSFSTVAVDGAVTPIINSNITSITSSALGNTYTIALNVDAVTGTDIALFIQAFRSDGVPSSIVSYSYSANTLVINIIPPTNKLVSFQILQD